MTNPNFRPAFIALAFFPFVSTVRLHGQITPPACQTGSTAAAKPYDAIIVGAGLAGLAAARELQNASLNILVLESNNRIGGRGYVGKIGTQLTPIDYGGAWLHDDDKKRPNPTDPVTQKECDDGAVNPVKCPVQAVGLKRISTDFNAHYYDGAVQVGKDMQEKFEKVEEEYTEALEQAEKTENGLVRDLCTKFPIYQGQRDPIQRTARIASDIFTRIPTLSVRDAESLSIELSVIAGIHIPHTAERFCSTASSQLKLIGDRSENFLPRSLTYADQLPILIGNSGPLESAAELSETSAHDAVSFAAGEDEFVPGGMGGFVTNYGSQIPVCLSTPVSAIQWGSKIKSVVAGGKTFRAANVIVTVSTGVLQHEPKIITFHPQLPLTTQSAIKHLQMGHMQKVIIPFTSDVFPPNIPDSSWVLYKGVPPKEVADFARKHDLPLFKDRDDKKGEVVLGFVFKPLKANIAVVFFGGKWARALEEECMNDPAAHDSGRARKCDHLAITMAKSALTDVLKPTLDANKQNIDDVIEKDVAAPLPDAEPIEIRQLIQVTRWSLDPTSFGAYSVAAPGFADAHAALAKPIAASGEKQPHLYFAGEATGDAKYNGSYPAAYLSGIKAAKEIEKHLETK